VNVRAAVAIVARATCAWVVALWLTPGIAAEPAAQGPALDRARSGPCVEDPKLMRRIHMDLVRHGRDDTVRLGIRDRKTSLAACVDCHANAKDGSVVGSDTHFCQGCHSYAAVKIECFECHSSRARETVRVTNEGLSRAAAEKGGS
jgi:[DsrC]-trisulfide reductase subunit J